MADKFRLTSTYIKDLNPEEYKDKIVTAKDGLYGSVMQNNNKFKWKKYDEDKYSNAINAYIYWNNLSNDYKKAEGEEAKKHFKYPLKNINGVISTFKKKLVLYSKKYGSEYVIDLYYDENQGKWYDGELHFVDYLWTDVCELVERKYNNGDWLKYPFFMTDDIYVINAMLKNSSNRGKLTLQHHIPNQPKHMFSLYKKIITEAYSDTVKEHSNILKKKQLIFKSDKVVTFEFK